MCFYNKINPCFSAWFATAVNGVRFMLKNDLVNSKSRQIFAPEKQETQTLRI